MLCGRRMKGAEKFGGKGGDKQGLQHIILFGIMV